MPLGKSKGNMYPWVTHTHSHLAGACPNGCAYCYVKAMPYEVVRKKYSGPVRLIEKELEVNYGSGKTIFIEHMSDLFSCERIDWIGLILKHCSSFPDNQYVFQTKRPNEALKWKTPFLDNHLVGTTIESNRNYPQFSGGEDIAYRYLGISGFKRKFVTIEPVMDFDLEVFLNLLTNIKPEFVNIGADSKGRGLPEPSGEKVKALIAGLQEAGIEIRQKANLGRLMK